MSEDLLQDILSLEKNLKETFPFRISDGQYRVAKIFQKGKVREIHEPVRELAELQRQLAKLIYRVFKMHPALHSVPERSIITNAEQHVGAKALLKMDIKKYFNSIKPWHVLLPPTKYNNFYHHNLALGDVETFAYNIIPPIGFVRFDNAKEPMLPTGAPSSPAIANLVGYVLDCRLSQLATECGYIYTRYMDDLTFSCIYEYPGLRGLETIVASEVKAIGFDVNEDKTEICYASNTTQKFHVTGINLPRDGVIHRIPYAMRRLIRARINNQHKGTTLGQLDSVTQGYLAYVKAIEPDLYHTYVGQLNAPRTHRKSW